MDNTKIAEADFIGTKVYYDKDGQTIIAEGGKANVLADVRAYGAISSYFLNSEKLTGEELINKSNEFQDKIGEWIVDAINAALPATPTTQKIDVDKIVIDIPAMRADKSDGSYYYSWQANIAMAFKDEYERFNPNMQEGNKEILHRIANNAAKNFLDMLLTTSHTSPTPTTGGIEKEVKKWGTEKFETIWPKIWDLCQSAGMRSSPGSGLENVIDFLNNRKSNLINHPSSSQPNEVKGGVWVKASDRLPDKKVNAKHARLGPKVVSFRAGNYLIDSNGVDLYELKDIEWLDESQSPIPVQKEEAREAVEFGEWLIKTSQLSTDGKYVVHKGENFWTIPQLYNLYKQSNQ